jgi:hypothetical protein
MEKSWVWVSRLAWRRKAGGVAPVVECLPSKHEDLSSNLSTEEKRKKHRKVPNQKIVLNIQIYVEQKDKNYTRNLKIISCVDSANQF